MTRIPAIIAVVVLSFGVAACSGGGAKGVRFLSGESKSSSRPKAQAIANLSGSAINSAIVGKTFQYTRPDGNGFVTYAGNGTFSYQDDSKGEGTGKWSVSGSTFCETFQGRAQDCGVFRSTGDAYFAAKSRLVEMKS